MWNLWLKLQFLCLASLHIMLICCFPSQNVFPLLLFFCGYFKCFFFICSIKTKAKNTRQSFKGCSLLLQQAEWLLLKLQHHYWCWSFTSQSGSFLLSYLCHSLIQIEICQKLIMSFALAPSTGQSFQIFSEINSCYGLAQTFMIPTQCSRKENWGPDFSSILQNMCKTN